MSEILTTNQHGSETTSEGIRVRVVPEFLSGQSNPEANQYVFGYRVRILNEGDDSAQLIARRWLIIDANGEEHEVEGPGVVGHQPVLDPGKGFEYSSYCPLETPWGTMEGAYRMQRDDGSVFDANIGRFYLVAPGADTDQETDE